MSDDEWLTVTVEPDEVDGGWVAGVVNHEGLMAQGESRGEALAALARVVRDVDELESQL